MRLDEIGLLVGLGFLLGLAEFLDEAHRLALETAVEAAAGAGVNDIAELFGGEVEKSEIFLVRPSDFQKCDWSCWTYWSRSIPR